MVDFEVDDEFRLDEGADGERAVGDDAADDADDFDHADRAEAACADDENRPADTG